MTEKRAQKASREFAILYASIESAKDKEPNLANIFGPLGDTYPEYADGLKLFESVIRLSLDVRNNFELHGFRDKTTFDAYLSSFFPVGHLRILTGLLRDLSISRAPRNKYLLDLGTFEQTAEQTKKTYGIYIDDDSQLIVVPATGADSLFSREARFTRDNEQREVQKIILETFIGNSI